jgi:hypothetical protein
MAALAHLGVGLAAKPLAPEVNVGYLILGNYVLDILWNVFALVGIETWPRPGVAGHPPWWDHSLLMAVVWSVLFGLLASWLGRRTRHRTHIGVIFGLMVFAHWIVDFITHPMTAIMPPGTVDKGLPLAFGNSTFVGLGLYRTMAGVWITEIGSVVAGLAIYIAWRVRMRRLKAAAVPA